ncbi:MAG: methyltransferase domain-containing protein [Candidatus Omnitrophica bacterium]|nr:methyltransferase domain-containing protein [Candidatus Omnitrophota bacterium]
MTQAQADASLCGMIPEETEPRFFAQHLCAYEFARPHLLGKRVLEVGFGEGYGSHWMADLAREVVGIDIVAGNVPRAQARYQRPNLQFRHMDATALDFPSGSFDVVCSFQVIEHVPEPQLLAYLREIFRVLTPQGVFCVSTLNLANSMKPGRPYQKLIYHEKEFTGPELDALLRQVFPSVDMRGLFLSPMQRVVQRFKRWGLHRLGPPQWNPIARAYHQASTRDFVVRPCVTRSSLDLFALCRKA